MQIPSLQKVAAPYTGVVVMREISAGQVVVVDEVHLSQDARFSAALLDVKLWQELVLASLDAAQGAEGE